MPVKGLVRLTLLLVIVLVVSLLVLATVGAKEQEDVPKQVSHYTRNVFLIIIDGLQGEVLQEVQAPNINGISSAGARVTKAIGVYPPSLDTGVATILTGTDPLLHRFQKPGDKLAEPTILQLLEQRKVGTAFFDGSGGRLKAVAQGVRAYQSAGNDEDIMKMAIKQLNEKQPYLSVIVLSEPGTALADSGRGSQEYKHAVSEADNRIGELLRFLHQQMLYEDALVIITGTTGEPPIIVKGIQFKAGVVLPPAGIIDVAPTLAYALGLKLPEADGLVLWNAMEPGSFQNGLYLMEQRIKDLSQAQVDAYEEVYRLRDEQNMVNSEKEQLNAEKNATSQAISARDQEIRRLGSAIRMLMYGTLVLIIVFGLGYLYEYRYLKRKFLLFP